jgi:O-antigen/teichoic acid export membrane protein
LQRVAIQLGLGALRRIGGAVPTRAIWSGIDAAAGPFSSLAIAAGLLRALGTQNYGLIVVALAVSNLSTAINPAIAATTTKFVAEAVGAGAPHVSGVSRVVCGSLLAVTLMDVLFIALTVSFGGELAQLVFGGVAGRTTADLGDILLLAVSAICIQQLDSIFAAALRGLERFAHQAAMEVCSRVVLVTAVISVAFATHSVHASLAAYCYAYGASTLARALLVRSVSPERKLLARPGGAELRRLLTFGGWMWLNALATIAYGTLDRILIGRYLGASAVARFSVYTQLAQLVQLAPSSLFGYVYPMFSRLYSQQGPTSESLRRLYRGSFRTCILIGAGLLLGLLLFRGQLTHLMGGKSFQSKDGVLVLLGLSYFVLTFNIVPYYFLLGVGKSRTVSLLCSVSMAASVLCMIFLIPAYGESGAALARFAYGFGALALVFQSGQLLRKK